MIRVLHPWYLLLLLTIPLVWYAARNVRVLGKGRKTLTLILRTWVLVFFIFALAEVEWLNRGEGLAVFFAIDRSSSIPQDDQQFSLAYVQERLEEIPKGDQAGILFFGKDAAIQEIPSENVTLEEYQTIINPEGTDIAGAINLAMAAFPEGKQKRIVLLTDGNQTQGDAEAAVRRAVSNGIDVRVLPLKYSYSQEVLVEDLVVPTQIREDEPYTIKTLISAQEPGPAKLRIRENGELITEKDVELQAGKNAFQISRSVREANVYNYEVTIEAENDRRPSNNRARNFVVVRGQPRVLLVESEPTLGEFLAASLSAEGIQIEMITPDQMPSSLRDLQIYDSIILSNVPAAELAKSQERMLESAVRDIGIGLIMIGGPRSFDAGGYRGSPVEEALPVTMSVKQKRIMPSGALALIMHSCEIPQGNFWAQEVSLAALDVLSSQDYVGFLRYGRTGESWLFPLEPAGNKAAQRRTITNLRNNDVGDMPSFDVTLEMAYDALTEVDANIKHIVILSDGDPQAPNQNLLDNIKEANITISTVCIAPHNPSNSDLMRNLAQFADGNYYLINNNKNLPRVFTKEATTIRRNSLVEETFTPSITQITEVIRGFEDGFPQLDGYVVSGPRPQAETVLVSHKEDPILAHWHYGLGKSVAFTSDAKSRWAEQWLGWEGYGKFWSQVVRWTLRAQENNNFQIQTTLEDDRVKVSVDALTPDGEFVNNLNFSASSIDPNVESQEFEMRQSQPGRYEGSFPADEPGNYFINMNYADEENIEGNVTTGITVPYSPEHSTTRQNDALLKRLADLGGHPFLIVDDYVYTHDLYATGQVKPLWPLLLALAIVLFFFDIAVRRVFFDIAQIQAFFARAWNWIVYPFTRKTAAEGPATEGMGKLMQAKERTSIPPTREPTEISEKKQAFIRQLDESKEEDLAAMDQPKEKSTWHEVKKDEEPEPLVDEEDTYTSALKRAKKRARDDMDNKHR